MHDIPESDSVSARWLTVRLREAGHAGATVRAFDAKRIGTGQIGKCIRFTLDVAGDPTAPLSLVGKFPSDDPTSRATGVMLRNYIKEVSFYRTMRSRVSITTPRCYFAEIEGDGPRFALLLEDLAPARQGDQLTGCSEGVARAAVLELVGLHAPSWCDASLRGIDWLGEPTHDSADGMRRLYCDMLPGFLARYGAQLAPDEVGIIEAMGASRGEPFGGLPTPFSLVHIDYRLDNLLIDERSVPPRIAVVDWQSITLGRPLGDVAYFLGAGLLPERRRAAEREIVRAYHDALRAAGIGDYGWQQCWDDYRLGAFAGFSVTVVASMLVQQTQRGDAMFVAMARRHARHALDVGAREFLS